VQDPGSLTRRRRIGGAGFAPVSNGGMEALLAMRPSPLSWAHGDTVPIWVP
jgi:hypothetical protein